MVLLKKLGNFCRTLEMSLINCEISLVLTWPDIYVLFNNAKPTTFGITDIKFYVPVATSSNQDIEKLLQQLKFDQKRTINQNKYQSKISIQAPKQFSDFLIDPSFQGVNRLFVLSFENTAYITVHTKY